jgi:hypothetical protein
VRSGLALDFDGRAVNIIGQTLGVDGSWTAT